MTPDLALIRQWSAALRRGDYRQGTGRLHSGDAFCCLGVVTDLAVQAGDLPAWEDDGLGDCGVRGSHGLLETTYLPSALVGRLGLRGSGAKRDGSRWTIGGAAYPSLGDANDQGVTFDAIADALDAWTAELSTAEAAGAATSAG